MYQQIGGFIGDLIPFGLFLYFTLVLFGVIKLNNKPKILENPPKYFKIIAVTGMICFAIWIVIRIIELI
jgi:hypothetical protein